MHPFKMLWSEHLGFDDSSAIEYRNTFYENINEHLLSDIVYKMPKRVIIEVPTNLFGRGETVYEEKILHSGWMEGINHQMEKTQEQLCIDEESMKHDYYIRDYARGYIVYAFYNAEEKFAVDMQNDSGLWEMVACARSTEVASDIASALWSHYSKFTPFRCRVQDEICKTLAPSINPTDG